jgi:hypothetical protein
MLTKIRDIKNISENNGSVLQKRPELYNTNYSINGEGT